MIYEQKWNILIGGLLILGAVAVSSIYKFANQKNSLLNITALSSIAIYHGDNDIDYKAYTQYLREKCPVYEPDGNSWKNCLYDLLLEKEAEVKTILGHINTELPKTIERLTKRKEMTQAFEYIPGILKEFNISWFDYRNKFCELDYEAYAAGTATQGYIKECEVYETQKYIGLLNRWDKEWNVDFEDELNEQFQSLK